MRRSKRTILALSIASLLGAAPLLADEAGNAASARADAVRADGGMVSAEHPLAAKAGAEMFASGGNAIDAAVAAAFAIGVLHPSSCGIGGGGFALIRDGRTGALSALDFRELAPAGASRDMYLREGTVDARLSVRGGLAVGVPGEVRGLLTVLEKFGRLSRTRVLEPAIRFAIDGIPVDRHLEKMLAGRAGAFREDPELAAIYLDRDGRPLSRGDLLVQADLASTLRAIRDGGADVFYSGKIARAISASVQRRGGVLTESDLRSYKTTWRNPLVASYRDVRVVGFPPPSSGGGILLEILKILEGFDASEWQRDPGLYRHLMTEAERFAFADRATYYGDSDFVDVPLPRLLSDSYVLGLRSRISPTRRAVVDTAPIPEEQAGTSHLSSIDSAGNAVALTSTINTAFGSHVLVPGTGIVLNNQMDDFSAAPGAPNVYGLVGSEANSIRPGKRPLSSMSPTIVLDGERPVLVVGGSGGPRIITATLQVVLGVLDFQMPLADAIAAPRTHHQWKPDILFHEPALASSTIERLQALGHETRSAGGLGAVQGVAWDDLGLVGAADPRKGGGAAGWSPEK